MRFGMGIWALVGLGGLVAGALFCGRSFEAALLQSTRAAATERETILLTQGIAELKQQAPEIQTWRNLLAQAAPLDPTRLRRYAITVARETSWEETAALLLVVSNAHPRPGGYRFDPGHLKIARVSTDDNATERYQLELTGQFLSLEQRP